MTNQKIDPWKKKNILEQLQHLQSFVQKLEEHKPCIACFNWDTNKKICNIAKQEPPEHVLHNGCPSWSLMDDIPF